MEKYNKSLDENGWSRHYNHSMLRFVIDSINDGNVQVWAHELLKIIPEESSFLEVGCGTGISSLWLAKHNRRGCALDYTSSSVELVRDAARQIGLSIDVVKADATHDLPFEKKQFDYIFQSGLLEHFHTEQQITLLSNWMRYGRTMISMIPNRASVPYRIGKAIMERDGTWEYGMEIPKHTLIYEFEKAGIHVEREYTIGAEWALRFLPDNHMLKKMYEQMYEQMTEDAFDLDDMMQGYLLVTIGRDSDGK